MKVRNIPFSPPDISEKEINNVIEVLKSGWITTGPKTKEFERQLAEFMGTEKVVCLNSATAALELALRVLGVGPGDEVIVPAFTYTASCSVIEHVGATPVMVDIQEDHFEMNYDALEAAITEKTKVVIPVELADFASFSFHAVKNLTTAEGGCITWNPANELDSEAMYKEFQVYSLHGQTKDALAKIKPGSWEYDIVIPGYKCNMADVMAAIGLGQLERYPELLERRKEIVRQLDAGLAVDSRIQVLQHEGENYQSSRHLYITRIKGASYDQRGEIIIKMAERGISCNVHYKPLPLLTAYQNMGFKMEDYPNAYRFFENEVTLPLHGLLSDEDIDYIVQNYLEVIKEVLGQ